MSAVYAFQMVPVLLNCAPLFVKHGAPALFRLLRHIFRHIRSGFRRGLPADDLYSDTGNDEELMLEYQLLGCTTTQFARLSPPHGAAFGPNLRSVFMGCTCGSEQTWK